MSKTRQLSLKENFSWNFVGSVVYSASQFFILILLAKFGNPVMVGLYSIGLAITAPIIMLTNLQLRQIQATDTSNYYTFNDYFGLRIISGIVAICITLVILAIGGYDFKKSIIILLVALTKIMDSYSDVIYGQLQQHERMDYIGKSRVIKGVLTIVVMGITLFITRDLINSLIVLTITWFLIFWIYDKRKIKLFIQDIKPSFSYSKLKQLVILALPLGIVLMLGSLNTNLPRIFVDKFYGEEMLGYFASIAYLLVVGNTFVQSVGQAASPRLAKLYKNRQFDKFKKIMLFLMLIGLKIGLFAIIISIVLGELILEIIYDSSYADYNHILVLVMVASTFTFLSSFLGYNITAMRLFKVQPIIGLVSLIITLVSSLILIPTYGLVGAAYTLIIGGIAQCILKLAVTLFNLKRSNNII
ncbi:oligosaccharide flippase family protein [Oceanobacillus luteolus]|uniref:Oligosaccharide flippase family protein n=1 Tax=Oceanobacillus luteolus TaxID=1274358 RepID=A0ABW4HPS5_9BACI